MTKPTASTENPFEKYIGAAPAFSSRQEINAWIRELRDDEDAEETLPRDPQEQE